MSKKERFLCCETCGAPVVRTGPTQKYCQDCSEARARERSRKWARKHPRSDDEKAANVAYLKEKAGETREAGAARSVGQSMAWDTASPDLIWMVRIKVPFSYAVSKNHIYSMTGSGHVFKRKESNAMRQSITMMLRSALIGRRVVQNKVWLDILVQKPNHKGDAVNVVDLVCDAIKDAIPVDDRWYSIRRLDWEIVKRSPSLFIGIGQDSDIDMQACSACGMILEYAAFNRSSHNKNGVSRECKKCRSAGAALVRSRRKACDIPRVNLPVTR